MFRINKIKKQFAVLALLMVIVASAGVVRSQSGGNASPQCVYFFYESGCQACEDAKAYISQVELNYTNLAVHSFEVGNSTNFNLMTQYYQAHNISVFEVPVIFIGDHVLVGPNDIESQLVPLLDNDTGASCPVVNATNSASGSPPLSIIAGMAFADSLNPCAITVLLILIALSATTVGIWKTGVSYILGNFCAYLLVGVGLFTILRQFNLPMYTSKVIGVATMVLAIASLFLKIPEGSKPTISKLLHAATSPIFAFFAGAAISAIELPCTGGPYFLTLTLMSQYNIPQWATLGYLLLYNTIFVLPLVVVLLIYHFAHAPEIPKKYIRWTSAILLFLLGLIIVII